MNQSFLPLRPFLVLACLCAVACGKTQEPPSPHAPAPVPAPSVSTEPGTSSAVAPGIPGVPGNYAVIPGAPSGSGPASSPVQGPSPEQRTQLRDAAVSMAKVFATARRGAQEAHARASAEWKSRQAASAQRRSARAAAWEGLAKAAAAPAFDTVALPSGVDATPVPNPWTVAIAKFRGEIAWHDPAKVAALLPELGQAAEGEKKREGFSAAWEDLKAKAENPALAFKEEGAFVEPEPVPPNGDPKSNQSFDDLIYAFRRAVNAKDHAKAQAVMAQMAELAPKVSPALMETFQGDAKQYFATLPPEVAP